MIVMTQLFAPGHPVMACGYNSTLDMATGNANIASVETGLGAGRRRAVHEGGLPGSGADGVHVDGFVRLRRQTVMAKSLNGMLCAMAGADIAYGAGRLGGSTLASPVQLIIDDRVTALLRRYVDGVQVDDETLGLETILRRGRRRALSQAAAHAQALP